MPSAVSRTCSDWTRSLRAPTTIDASALVGIHIHASRSNAEAAIHEEWSAPCREE